MVLGSAGGDNSPVPTSSLVGNTVVIVMGVKSPTVIAPGALHVRDVAAASFGAVVPAVLR